METLAEMFGTLCGWIVCALIFGFPFLMFAHSVMRDIREEEELCQKLGMKRMTWHDVWELERRVKRMR